jgi:hypothetical protein
MKYGESLQRTSVPGWSLREFLFFAVRRVTANADQGWSDRRDDAANYQMRTKLT